MIECPFCGESFSEEKLVYEFNWGEIATYLYNRKFLKTEPKSAFLDRSVYVTMKYGWNGRPTMKSCTPAVNPLKHPGVDPLISVENGWQRILGFLAGKRVFEVECADDNRKMPTGAKILPMLKHHRKRGTVSAEGMSTGMFCPLCEQQLKPEVLKAKTEIRIVLSGRPGSGKTVYVTQAISELMTGRLTQKFNIEAANKAVHEHYNTNKSRLKAFGNGFVLATNPGEVQQPYIFLLTSNEDKKNSVRLVIQDIAGEDTENRTKYSKAVRKADLLLLFIDPWHIEEVRSFHKKNGDASNAIVDRSTKGRYTDLTGVFEQMLSTVDRKFTKESGQLAGVLLIKGDYLNPPMLARGNQPECEMMQKAVSFNNAAEMEFSVSMRSSFIRQCLYEWESTRVFARDVEGKYSAHNIRYFVASALGQSTYLKQADSEEIHTDDAPDSENPDAQFAVGGGSSVSKADTSSDGKWSGDEQMLESAARPEHVIDPIFWCMKRRGIDF